MNILKKIILILVFGFLFFTNTFAEPEASTVSPDIAGEVKTNSVGSDAGTISLAGEVKTRMGNPTHSSSTTVSNKLGAVEGDDANGILTRIVKFARESIFNLLWVIVVGVLLYIGFKLIIGKGTPDVFKKAMSGLVYLIIGIIIIFSAWAMIKIILGVSV